MNTIVKMVYGSHLYGTNTEKSDTDYKGIYLPELTDVFLGRFKKSISDNSNTKNTKNSPEDVDCEYYSLQHFIHMACVGETVALDMLHAPSNMIIEKSPVWDYMVANKHLFYSKNIKAFVGYASNQVKKYCIKAERKNTFDTVIKVLKDLRDSNYGWEGMKLLEIWDKLPNIKHVSFHPAVGKGERMFEVCGKKLGEKVSLAYAINTLEIMADAYGHRTQKAVENNNVDWKAVSHACRVLIEVEELLKDKTITLPLPEKKRDFVLKVKNGGFDMVWLSPYLEYHLSMVEHLLKRSDLPDTTDVVFWDDFVVRTYMDHYHIKRD